MVEVVVCSRLDKISCVGYSARTLLLFSAHPSCGAVVTQHSWSLVLYKLFCYFDMDRCDFDDYVLLFDVLLLNLSYFNGLWIITAFNSFVIMSKRMLFLFGVATLIS